MRRSRLPLWASYSTHIEIVVDDLPDERDLVGFAAINVEDIGLFAVLGLKNLLDRQGQQAPVARPLLGACRAPEASEMGDDRHQLTR